MDERRISEREADAINEEMARRIEERRRDRGERRQNRVPVAVDRRKICSFCFEPGDHPSAKDCFRALERDLTRRGQ